MRRFYACLAITLLAVIAGAKPIHAQTAHFSYAQETISGFSGTKGVAVDSAGSVYVADFTANAVYKVSVGCAAFSCATTLPGGYNSPSGVAVDSSGNVYVADSGNNAIKEIPSNCTNAACVTALGGSFAFNDPGGVAVDSTGNVYVADTYYYGGTANNGAVEELSPGCNNISCVTFLGGGFLNPAGVGVDQAGNVYVADSGNNLVKKMAPGCLPANTATCVTTLGGGFSDPIGVAADSSGNVYVGDFNNNAVNTIPSGCTTSSCVTTLATGFNGPENIALDESGDVFVADYGQGAITEIMPHGVNFGSVSIGSTSPVQSLTFTFDSGGTINAPVVVTQAAVGLDFASAGTGTCTTNGTSHNYNISDTCTVNATFTPQYAGLRMGAVELMTNSGAVMATAYIYGTGTGPQVAFSPATQTVIAENLNHPTDLAVDGSGNIYTAEYFGNDVLKETLSNGTYTQSTVATGLSGPFGVAVDGAGNVYIADSGNNRVLEETPSNGSYTQTVIVSGLNGPYKVAVDGNGNVYIAEYTANDVLKETLSNGSYTQSTVASGLSGPWGVAVDENGNVYIAEYTNNDVLKETLSNGSYTQSVVASGLGAPQSVAVDGLGNVYIGDSGDNDAFKETLSNGSYTQSTIATGLSDPSGVVVDEFGNVYIADSSNNRILKEDFADAPSLSFASTSVGSTSSDSPKTATLENIGNAPLIFPVPGFGQNPAISANFTIDGSATCPVLQTSSPAATLASGASCTLAVNFTPESPGSISGSLVLTDTNLNASPSTTQTIALNGIATGLLLSPAASALTNGTVGIAYSQTFTANGGSGTYTYSETGALPNGLSLNTSTGTLSGTPTTAGTYSFSVEATDTTGDSSSPQAYTLEIVKGTATVGLGGLNQAYTGSPVSATATTSPAGLTVDFTYNGSSTAPTAAGSYAVVATVDDANYTGSATGTLVIGRATPTVTWAAPIAIPYGTALSAAQLNATASYNGASVPGSFHYEPALGTVLSPGTHTLSVTFTPTDTTDYATPQAVTTSITVTSEVLTVTANNATRVYGTANPTFTGSIAGAVNGDTFTESFSTTATTASNAGTYAIVPSAAGANLSNYTVAINDGTLTVTLAATMTTLSASATSITPGQSLTLTAQVASATTGTPTGTVSFYDGTTLLGISALSNGTASYTASSLSPDVTHVISATYSGDTNFSRSTSSSTVSVPITALDFSLTTNGATSQTVIPGGASSYSFQISPTYRSYPAQVTLTAAGLPAGATATFSPATIPANGGTQTVTLAIQTAQSTTSAKNGNPFERGGMALALGFLIFPLLGLRRVRKTLLGRSLMLVLLATAGIAGMASLSGCGTTSGFSGTAVKNYTITVTASSGGIQHSSDVNLNLQ